MMIGDGDHSPTKHLKKDFEKLGLKVEREREKRLTKKGFFFFFQKKIQFFSKTKKNYIMTRRHRRHRRLENMQSMAGATCAGVGALFFGIARLFREYEPKKCESLIWRDALDKTPSQNGKTIVITGSTSGTGLALAKGFAEKGAKVLMLNRRSERSEQALKEVIEVGKAHGAPVAVNIECDLQKIFFRTTSHRGGEEERGRFRYFVQ